MAVVSPKRGLWLLDNAADVHVCNNRDLFLEYRIDVESLTGVTASGASPGKGLTRVQLALEDGSPGALIILHETWYMPQCPVNLISQGRLNNSGVHYNDENWCLYLKDSRDIIGYVRRINNNYVFKTLDNPDMAVHLTLLDDNATYQWPETEVFHSSTKQPLSIWHARLGHLNIPNLRQHLKLLEVAYTDDSDKDFHCEACQLSKATKLYNRVPQERATRAFQKIHTDMVGPIKPVGLLLEVYFFTFTCDFTRFTHMFTAINKHCSGVTRDLD